MQRSTEPRREFSQALAGALGRCPACGRGSLFSGYIAVPPSCGACGQDFRFADSGDGPAVFVMLIAGFLALGFVLWVEFTYAPPYWVHVVVSLPVTLLICLALLRVFKGLLIALQFKHDAAEGRLDV